jgi:hypothetical protein
MITSGFKSQSDRGVFAKLPVMTSKVALYGAKVATADHDCEEEAVIVVGALEASV